MNPPKDASERTLKRFNKRSVRDDDTDVDLAEATKKKKENPINSGQERPRPTIMPSDNVSHPNTNQQHDIMQARHDFKGGVSVIKYLRKFSIDIEDNKILSEEEKSRAAIALQGMKVRPRHTSCGRRLAIEGLTAQITKEITVEEKYGDEQTRTTDLVGFFLREYHCAIKYKGLPCLDLGRTSDFKPVYIPMEWCAVYGKDNPSCKRLQSIFADSETPRERLYPDSKFLENKWFILFCGKNRPCSATLDKFRESMVSNCGDSIISPGGDFFENVLDVANLQQGFSNVKTKTQGRDLKILLCVMEKKSPGFYKALKQAVEVEGELPTQCCLLEQIDHYCDLYDSSVLRRTDYVVNLALEMIAKVRTETERRQVLLLQSPLSGRFGKNSKVMYLGLDVTQCYPYVAVLVGSTGASDRTTLYKSTITRQDSCEHTIKGLPAMFGELLDEYSNTNGSLPDKILFFRHGVSGGQHERVLMEEVSVLKMEIRNRALDQLSKIPEPAQREKFSNLLTPISVIVAHKNNRGAPATASSVKFRKSKAIYRLFSDENAITESELQTLINNLCHTSARCTNPLPLYYARLAARRTQQYLEAKNDSDIDKIRKAIDKSLIVCGKSEDEIAMEKLENRPMEE